MKNGGVRKADSLPFTRTTVCREQSLGRRTGARAHGGRVGHRVAQGEMHRRGVLFLVRSGALKTTA